MRYEYERSGTPTRWFVVDILALPNDIFSVVMTYGFKSPEGEESVVQELIEIFRGSYPEAENVYLGKVKNREQVGYKKIEPKPETQ